MTLTDEEKLSRPFDAKEAAEYLRLSEKTTLKLLREGTLPAVKMGRQWRISRRAIEEYVASGGKRKDG